MNEPALPSGTLFEQEIRFSSVSGEVAAVDRQTDTHFETRGGSVMVFGNMVSVTAPTVTAHTQVSKNVWVRQEDGTELSIVVPDDVQARAGHKVGLLVSTGMQEGKLTYQWCAIANHSTGHWNQLDRLPPINFGLVSAKYGPVNFMLLWVAGWILAFVACSRLFSSNEPGPFIFLVVVFFFSSIILGRGRVSTTRDGYRKAVKRAVDAVFAAGYPERAPAAASAASG